MLALARIVRLAASLVALLIVVAIVLRLAGANGANTIVRDIHDAAGTLVGPFKNVFTIKNGKEAMVLNWGLAAVIYLIVGHALASFLARAAPTGIRRTRAAY
jgi:hypothetical protein